MSEVWKGVVGYEGFYEVSSYGQVRSLDREVGHRWGGSAIKKGKILSPQRDKDGYVQYGLSKSGKTLTKKGHRIVAEAFLERREGREEINHLNLVKSDNRPCNLQWCSRGENQAHAAAENIFCGKYNPKRAKKINIQIARDIRKKREDGLSYKKLGDLFGVSAPTAFRVVKDEIWTEK